MSATTVNSTVSLQQNFIVQRPERLLVGIILSMVLHAALLLAWRQGTRAPPAETEQARAISIWLRQPAPPPKTERAPDVEKPSRPDAARAARPKRRTPPDVIAMPERPRDEAAAPDAFTVAPAEPEAPHFDADAARRMARELANEPDPAKAGTAVAQLPPKPLASETRAARAIAKAKRRDCKDGIPGGLLAPLYLMMDKKDSGCKW
jgi:hypothetical protein